MWFTLRNLQGARRKRNPKPYTLNLYIQNPTRHSPKKELQLSHYGLIAGEGWRGLRRVYRVEGLRTPALFFGHLGFGVLVLGLGFREEGGGEGWGRGVRFGLLRRAFRWLGVNRAWLRPSGPDDVAWEGA